MIVPIVNLNGDKLDVLLEELADVREKLEAATKALRASNYANGRNYQLNPAGESREAYRQHCERVQTLERIAQELLELQYGIVGRAHQRAHEFERCRLPLFHLVPR